MKNGNDFPNAFLSRPYQTKALIELNKAIDAGHRRICYVLPTGGGKTVVAAQLAQYYAEEGARIAFIVHRKELVNQAVKTLSQALPNVPISIVSGGKESNPGSPVVVAMVQSLRAKRIQPPDMIFFDEAHHLGARDWNRWQTAWEDAVSIGLTATPDRTDGKGLKNYFDVLVHGPDVPSLVEDGYLAPMKTLVIPSDTYEEWQEATEDVRIGAPVKAYTQYAKGRRAIVFCWNVAHSKRLQSEFELEGVSATHVDGETPEDEREQIMDRFRDGEISVITNCNIISEGFDAPNCDCIIMAAPTRSLIRYLQCAGRGMRPHGGDSLFIDLSGNAHWHLGPQLARNWSLDGAEKIKKIGKPLVHNVDAVEKSGKEVLEEHIELVEYEPIDMSKYISKKEGASRLGVSVSAVNSWLRGGITSGAEYPQPKFGGKLFLLEDIEKFEEYLKLGIPDGITSARVCEISGIQRNYMYDLWKKGNFPKPKAKHKSPRHGYVWSEKDILDWVARRELEEEILLVGNQIPGFLLASGFKWQSEIFLQRLKGNKSYGLWLFKNAKPSANPFPAPYVFGKRTKGWEGATKYKKEEIFAWAECNDYQRVFFIVVSKLSKLLFGNHHTTTKVARKVLEHPDFPESINSVNLFGLGGETKLCKHYDLNDVRVWLVKHRPDLVPNLDALVEEREQELNALNGEG